MIYFLRNISDVMKPFWIYLRTVCAISLRRIDHSSRGVLLNVARRCMWSINLENEEAEARYEAVENTNKRVVMPGKRTNSLSN